MFNLNAYYYLSYTKKKNVYDTQTGHIIYTVRVQMRCVMRQSRPYKVTTKEGQPSVGASNLVGSSSSLAHLIRLTNTEDQLVRTWLPNRANLIRIWLTAMGRLHATWSPITFLPFLQCIDLWASSIIFHVYVQFLFFTKINSRPNSI